MSELMTDRRDGRMYYRGVEVPDGPWHSEPDRVDFEAHGFPCILNRGGLGAWCGYVGVPKGHPWYGKGYDMVDATAHGGLTYARPCEDPICHETAGDDDRWWVGFDCNHGWDVAPGMVALHRMVPALEKFGPAEDMGTYRTVDYARAVTVELAAQASVAAVPTVHP